MRTHEQRKKMTDLEVLHELRSVCRKADDRLTAVLKENERLKEALELKVATIAPHKDQVVVIKTDPCWSHVPSEVRRRVAENLRERLPHHNQVIFLECADVEVKDKED